MGVLSWGNMVSFGFKRPCPLVGITQRRFTPPAPFQKSWGGIPKLMGHCSEKGGAPFRDATEKVPHFSWNQCPTSPGIRNAEVALAKPLPGKAEPLVAAILADLLEAGGPG